MRVSFERHFAHTREEVAEMRIAGKVSAQHERVDEETDQVFGLDVIAIRYRRADDDLILPRIATRAAL